MSYVSFKEHTAASVPTPSAGKKILYFDDSGDLLKYKDEAAVTRTVSFNDSVYEEIFTRQGRPALDQAAATLMFGGENATMVASATALVSPNIVPYFSWVAADYSVTGLTPKLRVRFSVATNATASAITHTCGLYPITIAGIADNLTYTLGTVTSGSTVATASPGASAVVTGTSGDFTVPADGPFALGVVTSGTLTNNSTVQYSAQVQVRNV